MISLDKIPALPDTRTGPASQLFIMIRVADDQGNTELKTIRYDAFVERLFKKEEFKLMVHHAKGGLCEEAGEVSSAIKQHVTYGKGLDDLTKEGQTIRKSIIEELGDVRFFETAVMHLYGISEQEVLQHNADKLAQRYVGLTYSDKHAVSRLDKVLLEEQIGQKE